MENVTLTGNSSCSNTGEFVRVAVVNQVVAALSFIASVSAIAFIIIFKKWQYFSQRLLIALIASNTFAAIFTELTALKSTLILRRASASSQHLCLRIQHG